MTNVAHALKTELAQLESELEADPRYLKIQRIRDLLAMYEEPKPGTQTRRIPVTAPANRGEPPKGHESKKAKLRREVSDLLRQRGKQHRTAILEHLTAKRLMGDEKDPMASLAQFLSQNKDLFVFDGEGNWDLKD
jgi:hypothetical protein